MLLYVLFLHADHYIIMHDETQTPLNSTKPFASGKHRMLYDLLLVLAQKYHETENWFSVLKIVCNYARKFANNHPSKAFIQEIKLLLITHILHKYQLGNIHVEMLDFASDFDADLREHCDVLSKRFAKPVQLSLAMPYKQYEERDYNVNRSASFIAQMHTHLMFEIVLSQLEQQRWCWTNCCLLKICLENLMPSPPLLSYKCFEKNDSKCSTINFGLDNFPDLCTNIKRAIGSTEKNNIKVNAVYPLSSIANVFEDYGRPRFVAHYNKKRLRFAEISSSFPSNIKTCKFEICRIDVLIANLKKICSDRGVSLSTILARFVTKYEYFYNFRDVYCKNFRLDNWKVYVEEHQKIMDKVYKKLEGINGI